MHSGTFRPAIPTIAALVLLAWSSCRRRQPLRPRRLLRQPADQQRRHLHRLSRPGRGGPQRHHQRPAEFSTPRRSPNTPVTITGGPAVTGGVGVSASDAAGSFQAVGSDVHVVGGELSHTQPKAFSGNSVSFRFRWRAPAYNGPVTLYAAGNSSNNRLNLLGDGIGTRRLIVTVRNGDPEPPPPPPPPPADAFLEPFVTGLRARS